MTITSHNQLERELSRRTDRLDARLGVSLTQEEYDAQISLLDDWYNTECERLIAAEAPRGYPTITELLSLGR